MNLPKTRKIPLLSGFDKRPQGIFRKSNIRDFFGFEFSFQNYFWNLCSTSGLCKICKIRNVWKFPSPFSRNTMISRSEKTYWSLKTSFWRINYPINSKMVMKIFSHVRSPKTMETLTPEKFS
jgi:hypothetical protein